MKLEDYIARFHELVEEEAKCRRVRGEYTDGSWIDKRDHVPFCARAKALLIDVFGPDHTYTVDFAAQGSDDDEFKAAVGILAAAERDLREGGLVKFRDLVAAEFFTDFMEMAEHYLSLKHKDPAAVMIGGVLEERLRQLCKANGIDTEVVKPNGDKTPKKADAMNADLMKASVYPLTQNKQVTAWQGLRNDAAHGDYSKYTFDQVQLMYDGVLDFLNRVTP